MNTDYFEIVNALANQNAQALNNSLIAISILAGLLGVLIAVPSIFNYFDQKSRFQQLERQAKKLSEQLSELEKFTDGLTDSFGEPLKR